MNAHRHNPHTQAHTHRASPHYTQTSAHQDALRRDFTINAMFYNVNEGRVEDLTNRGMDDLRAGIIRTPLTPMETFLDGEGSTFA